MCFVYFLAEGILDLLCMLSTWVLESAISLRSLGSFEDKIVFKNKSWVLILLIATGMSLLLVGEARKYTKENNHVFELMILILI